ncbi:MAG: PEP-CTERM sorting domain-containing protein, partial [Spirulina sp. SIO3F2]|nr:PEP-CTERM sorting domain-containing protein [Spirulina sp. SIO3F2]
SPIYTEDVQIPEPGTILGLLAIGGLTLLGCQRDKP